MITKTAWEVFRETGEPLGYLIYRSSLTAEAGNRDKNKGSKQEEQKLPSKFIF